MLDCPGCHHAKCITEGKERWSHSNAQYIAESSNVELSTALGPNESLCGHYLLWEKKGSARDGVGPIGVERGSVKKNVVTLF